MGFAWLFCVTPRSSSLASSPNCSGSERKYEGRKHEALENDGDRRRRRVREGPEGRGAARDSSGRYRDHLNPNCLNERSRSGSPLRFWTEGMPLGVRRPDGTRNTILLG